MAPHDLTLAEFHDLDQMCDDKELPVAPFGRTLCQPLFVYLNSTPYGPPRPYPFSILDQRQ